MTEDERNLLLTVARILRAVRREALDGYSSDDVADLETALNPFGPKKDGSFEDDGRAESGLSA